MVVLDNRLAWVSGGGDESELVLQLGLVEGGMEQRGCYGGRGRQE